MKSATSAGLSDSIEVSREPDRTIYRLPPRELGRIRLLGLIPFVIGLLILLWAARFSSDFVFNNNRAIALSDVPFGALVILVGLGMCYIPLGLGLAILWGRREIVLRGGKLRTTERAGPFWRTKRWKIDEIEELSVIGISGGMEPAPTEFVGKLDALVGRLRSGKRFMIAPAFPRALLGPLARDLATNCDRILRKQSADAPEPIIVSLPGAKRAASMEFDAKDSADALGDETGREPGGAIDGPIVQPAGSRVQIEKSASGLTLTVPPAGLRKGSMGLFLVAIFWCGFCALITGLILFGEPEKPGSKLGILAFMSLFWAVGIGLLLTGINMGRRRAAIAIVDGELMVLQTSIFRSKTKQWGRGEVAGVQVGPSGMEVNEVPVLELQVISTSGDKFGLLAGRDDEELRWMAYEARQHLELTEPKDGGAFQEILHRDFDEQPPDSRIEYKAFPNGFSLTIPPAGIRRGSHGFVNLGLFLVVVMGGITGAEIYQRMSVFAHPIGTIFTFLGWLAAGALIYAGISMGTRRAAVGVANDRLLITQSNWFASKKREYQPDEVAAVCAAPSGHGKDYQGLVELKIRTNVGGRHSFLCGQDKEELFWIATLIRKALDVPAELPEEPEADASDDADNDESAGAETAADQEDLS